MKILECSNFDIHLRFDAAMNSHALITGRSGSGKTYFGSKLMEAYVEQGWRCLIVDWQNIFDIATMERISDNNSFINIRKRGTIISSKELQKPAIFAQNLLRAYNFRGCYALTAMETAINELFQSKKTEEKSMQKICDLLRLDEDKWGRKVADRLSPEDGDLKIQFWENSEMLKQHTVELYDFSEMAEKERDAGIFLLLQNVFYRQRENPQKLAIFIDEFQNLPAHKGSILGKMLTEGRKYGISMILATQYLHGRFGKSMLQQLNQSAFQFFFQQEYFEAQKIAAMLANSRGEKVQIEHKLMNLHRGEALFYGPHSIENQEICSTSMRQVNIL